MTHGRGCGCTPCKSEDWDAIEAGLRGPGPINTVRDEWDARCHFCGGPSFPWLTDNETWAKVEPLLGQHQACFECFAAAWTFQGPTDRPFQVVA